jgi:hypothetical protein
MAFDRLARPVRRAGESSSRPRLIAVLGLTAGDRRVRDVRGFALVVGATVVLAGCLHDEPSPDVRDAFTVAINEDAARASRTAALT